MSIRTCLLLSCLHCLPFCALPAEQPYAAELTALATLLTYTPRAVRQKIIKHVQAALHSPHSPDEIQKTLITFMRQTEYTIQCTRTKTDAMRVLPPYGDPQYNPYNSNTHLNIVWQALLYCGIGCCVYLIICVIQDHHASTILNKKKKNNTLAEIETRQAALQRATTATINLTKTLQSRAVQ
jgi:hypothetical protein